LTLCRKILELFYESDMLYLILEIPYLKKNIHLLNHKFNYLDYCLKNNYDYTYVWSHLIESDKIHNMIDIFFEIYSTMDNNVVYESILDVLNNDDSVRSTTRNNLIFIVEKLLRNNILPTRYFIVRMLDDHNIEVLKLFVQYQISVKEILNTKTSSDFMNVVNQLDINIFDYLG
jgi:hypothetical protein